MVLAFNGLPIKSNLLGWGKRYHSKNLYPKSYIIKRHENKNDDNNVATVIILKIILRNEIMTIKNN